MDSLDGLLEFLNYGAAGVLALGFLLLVWLLWRRGEEMAKALKALAEKDERLDALLEVVRANTAALAALRLVVERNTQVIERLDRDMRD